MRERLVPLRLALAFLENARDGFLADGRRARAMAVERVLEDMREFFDAWTPARRRR